ncbi:MAG: phosphate ABC transporter permease subunit PstC [bacterium]
MYNKTSIIKENLFHFIALFSALCAIIFLSGIIISLFKEGYLIFKEVGISHFLFGKSWYPTQDTPEFGILSLLIGSIVVTVLALIISIPLGISSAIYISELAKPKEKEILKPFIELLASIPSVIYGLFGVVFLAPIMMNLFNLSIGLNAFTASIILGLMVVPIISSISEDAISSVPKSLREAAFALGANKWETIIRVVLPAAKSGIISSIILGFGRAIGETMVVLMVAGNAACIPKSIFHPVRPMTSAIAAEMGEAAVGSSHYNALFGIAIVLFVITFISNIITEEVRKKIRTK